MLLFSSYKSLRYMLPSTPIKGKPASQNNLHLFYTSVSGKQARGTPKMQCQQYTITSSPFGCWSSILSQAVAQKAPAALAEASCRSCRPVLDPDFQSSLAVMIVVAVGKGRTQTQTAPPVRRRSRQRRFLLSRQSRVHPYQIMQLPRLE